MILILEGEQHTFKSTIAQSFVNMGGWTVIRPFRRAVATRDEYLSRVSRLRSMGVPANRPAEDIIVADTLAMMPGIDVVLDRSLPSGLAHSPEIGPIVAKELRAEWTRLLREHGKWTIVYLTIDVERDERWKLRDGQNGIKISKYLMQTKRLEEEMRAIERLAPDNVFRLDVTGMDVAKMLDLVLDYFVRFIRGYANASSARS